MMLSYVCGSGNFPSVRITDTTIRSILDLHQLLDAFATRPQYEIGIVTTGCTERNQNSSTKHQSVRNTDKNHAYGEG